MAATRLARCHRWLAYIGLSLLATAAAITGHACFAACGHDIYPAAATVQAAIICRSTAAATEVETDVRIGGASHR